MNYAVAEPASNRNQQGVTLLELLIVLCIVSIIASMATPSFSSMASKHRYQADAEALLDAVQLARLTAVHEQTLTTLCPGTPDTGCSMRWQDGILVIADHPGNPYRVETLRFTLEAPVSTRWHGNVARLIFNEAGTLEGQSGSLILCSHGAKTQQAQRIVINRGGRPRIDEQPSPAAAERLCHHQWRF